MKPSYHHHRQGSPGPTIILLTPMATECVKEFDEPACVIAKHAKSMRCGLRVKMYLKLITKVLPNRSNFAFGGIIASTVNFNEISDFEIVELRQPCLPKPVQPAFGVLLPSTVN